MSRQTGAIGCVSGVDTSALLRYCLPMRHEIKSGESQSFAQAIRLVEILRDVFAASVELYRLLPVPAEGSEDPEHVLPDLRGWLAFASHSVKADWPMFCLSLQSAAWSEVASLGVRAMTAGYDARVAVVDYDDDLAASVAVLRDVAGLLADCVGRVGWMSPDEDLCLATYLREAGRSENRKLDKSSAPASSLGGP